LRWKAQEVAQLLETSVASVNSALQRARATLEARGVPQSAGIDSLDGTQRALLARYVAAFERYDMDELTSLLHDDATWSMPPYELWLQTHLDIRKWCLGPGIGCRGSRLIPTVANGSPAFGQYKPASDGGYEPWSLQVVEISGPKIGGLSFFLDTARLFPLFGLPHLHRVLDAYHEAAPLAEGTPVAVAIRPEKMSSLALARPTSRGRRWLPPAPGMRPSRISGWPSLALSAMNRKSQASATSQPPPRAYPLTAAMVTLGSRAKVSMLFCRTRSASRTAA
jgi:hypothetical protein